MEPDEKSAAGRPDVDDRDRPITERDDVADRRDAEADQREIDLECRSAVADLRDLDADSRDSRAWRREQLLEMRERAADARDRRAARRESAGDDRDRRDTLAAMEPVALAPETRRVLDQAGWHPGRTVDTTGWEAELLSDGFPPLHPVARRFLASYGGLWFPHRGPGISCAREAFNLAPTLCSGEADRFAEWSAHRGRAIAPIGEAGGGTCDRDFLGIDETGEIYLVMDRLASYGRMPLAMDSLILGYLPREIE